MEWQALLVGSEILVSLMGRRKHPSTIEANWRFLPKRKCDSLLFQHKGSIRQDTRCFLFHNLPGSHRSNKISRVNGFRAEIWKRGDERRGGALREILNTPKPAKKAARFTILTRILGQQGLI